MGVEYDIERIKVAFDINLETGTLIWKEVSKHNPHLLGTEAGTAKESARSGKFYWVITLDGKRLRRSWIIFLLTYGVLPDPEVDHIDGNSLHDAWWNLREATQHQNNWNRKIGNRNRVLPMGVKEQLSGRYLSRISYHGKQLHLGTYDTIDQARAAYLAKRKELYKEWA